MKELMSERMKGEKIMKTTMQEIKMNVYRLAVISLLVLSGTMQAAAVDYKNTYKSPMVGYQSATVGIQTTTATAPSASFQSTSAMPYATGVATTSTLNADGTVNSEAYGVGRQNVRGSRPRKVDSDGDGFDDETGNPVIDEDDDGNVYPPVGDAMLPLMLLACAFAFGKWFARRKLLR